MLLRSELSESVTPFAEHRLSCLRIDVAGVAADNAIRHCGILESTIGFHEQSLVQFLLNHLLTVLAEEVVLQGEDNSSLQSLVQSISHLLHFFFVHLFAVHMSGHGTKKSPLKVLLMPQSGIQGRFP